MPHRFNLAAYAQYGILAIVAATLGTFARMPFWLYPEKLPDGSPHPKAGMLNLMKALSELAGVPAVAAMSSCAVLAIIGLRAPNLDDTMTIFLIVFVTVLVALLSVAFIITLFEKASSPAIDIVTGALKRIFGGGGK